MFTNPILFQSMKDLKKTTFEYMTPDQIAGIEVKTEDYVS